MSHWVFTDCSFLDKIVTCIYLCRAAVVFNITIPILTSRIVTPTLLLLTAHAKHLTTYTPTTLHLLMTPNDDEHVNTNLKRRMVFSSRCLRSLAVHRSRKRHKNRYRQSQLIPPQSNPIMWLWCLFIESLYSPLNLSFPPPH